MKRKEKRKISFRSFVDSRRKVQLHSKIETFKPYDIVKTTLQNIDKTITVQFRSKIDGRNKITIPSRLIGFEHEDEVFVTIEDF